MVYKITNGKLILGDKIAEGLSLYTENDKICAITAEALPFDRELDAAGNYISPGFVDIHCHGGGNADFMDGTEDAYLTAARLHAQHGTTTLIPTTLSASVEELESAFAMFDRIRDKNTSGAFMPGFHLEGPYFAPSQAGAQDPKYIRPPQKDEYDKILAMTDKIMRWSSAPELPGTAEFAKKLCSCGVLPSIAHTDADYDCVIDAFKQGFTHITHLYSAMSTIHRKNAYRIAGVVEAAYMIDDMTVEIIADGKHLPASLLQFVYKFKGADRIALITDSMRGAGSPDGSESILGSLTNGQRVIIEDGVAKMPDRKAFAGSVATTDRLVRNMCTLAKAPLTDAVKMASATPARIMGIHDRGVLREGAFADVLIFDGDINIKLTMVNGNVVYTA